MKKYGEVGSIAGLIMIAISIVVAVVLIPTVATTVSTATNNTAGFTGANVTGAANTLLGITTMLFVAFVILMVYKMTTD